MSEHTLTTQLTHLLFEDLALLLENSVTMSWRLLLNLRPVSDDDQIEEYGSGFTFIWKRGKTEKRLM